MKLAAVHKNLLQKSKLCIYDNVMMVSVIFNPHNLLEHTSVYVYSQLTSRIITCMLESEKTSTNCVIVYVPIDVDFLF